MAKKTKKDLGKGIRALLGDDKSAVKRPAKKTATPATSVQEILLSEIEANPYQPRKDFRE